MTAVKQHSKPSEVIAGIFKGMRPAQWTKNMLVVAAPAAAGALFQPEIFLKTVAAVLIFCVASGATYLLNDAQDVESDRIHPTKRNRPVANGVVPVKVAYLAGLLLLVVSVVAAFVLAVPFGGVVVAYLTLTTMYSFGLKNVAVVDLVAVAAGFVLRAVAGGAATQVSLSEWFLLATSAGAMLLITAKREGELKRILCENPELAPQDIKNVTSRKVLSQYTPAFLASTRTLAAGILLVSYCLWAFDPNGANALPAVYAQISLLPFAVATLRYMLLADAGKAEKPEKLILTDKVLLASGTIWGVVYLTGVYLT